MLRSYQGRLPIIAETAYVDPSAQVLGDVTLGENSSIWMNAVVRGDVNTITIGAGSNVQDCAVIHGQRNLYAVTIGNGVTIGHNATVHGCTLEDDVLIGIGAIVLNGAIIGAGSIIAAGALVPERTSVPPRSLVTGIPGRILRNTTDADVELIRTYARNYLDYTKLYLAESDPTPTPETPIATIPEPQPQSLRRFSRTQTTIRE
jgi:carbonic anhydrase/acetyltransferase-like protein (isoleucine patch superfamily)